MAVAVVPLVNRGVKVSQKDLEFFVEVLTREDRERIFRLFKGDFEGKLSGAAISKLRRGMTHLSNENLVWLMRNNEEARRYIAQLLLQRAQKIMQLAEAVLAASEDEIEWPEEDEEEEGEEEVEEE